MDEGNNQDDSSVLQAIPVEGGEIFNPSDCTDLIDELHKLF
jgi:hypothetical protein